MTTTHPTCHPTKSSFSTQHLKRNSTHEDPKLIKVRKLSIVRELTIEVEMETSTTYDAVNDHYSRLARDISQGHNEHIQKAALSFGYSADELSAIPEGANLGVSCGNPIALAALNEASPFLFYVFVACNMC
jgi:hypothetical protein